MSTLYVVATPIGNLEDLSPRAQRILSEVDLILAEDTRVTAGLLNHFAIQTRLESHHLHNEREQAERIIARMQADALSVALVSDAGTPTISDPGAHLVGMAQEAGIPVIAVPGPSAVAAALSVCGFEEGSFTFYGFLPRKKNELLRNLQGLRTGAPLAVLYEAPHRVQELLSAIATVYPGAVISLSRELSKRFEQTIRASVEALLTHIEQGTITKKGEFVLVLQLPPAPTTDEAAQIALSLEAQLFDLLAQGQTLSAAQQALVQAGHRKNLVYAAALRLKNIANSLSD